MSVSELISGNGPAYLGEIALVLAFVAFAGIVIRTFWRPRREMDQNARLPIDDE